MTDEKNIDSEYRPLAYSPDGSNADKSGDAPEKLAEIQRRLAELVAQTGFQGVNLEALEIDLSILEILPREIAEQHVILPIAKLARQKSQQYIQPEGVVSTRAR